MSPTPWILVVQVDKKWTKKWISERDKSSKWNNDWKASNLFANAFHSVVQPRTWLNMNSRGEVSSSLVHLEGKNRWSNRVSIWKILIYTFKTNWVHWTPFLVLRSHKIDVFYWTVTQTPVISYLNSMLKKKTNPTTSLILDDEFLYQHQIDSKYRNSNSESYFIGSDFFRHGFQISNGLATLNWLRLSKLISGWNFQLQVKAKTVRKPSKIPVSNTNLEHLLRSKIPC